MRIKFSGDFGLPYVTDDTGNHYSDGRVHEPTDDSPIYHPTHGTFLEK
ncbi:MAG: hypothetical protein JEY91_00210 [Spirochaetaceae bacterium]|nr:hypothetical protein [Spirochaetaceae bacterium]